MLELPLPFLLFTGGLRNCRDFEIVVGWLRTRSGRWGLYILGDAAHGPLYDKQNLVFRIFGPRSSHMSQPLNVEVFSASKKRVVHLHFPSQRPDHSGAALSPFPWATHKGERLSVFVAACLDHNIFSADFAQLHPQSNKCFIDSF